MDCPSCGLSNPPDFHFCPSCGIALPAETGVATDRPGYGSYPPAARRIAEEPPRPLAERRLVSVLFLDLVGFTTLSESLDAEDVREVQSRYFESARATVAYYGGSLEKFIGDAVMAVWGTPVAHEDDGERAVRAALEIVAEVSTISVPGVTGHLTARAAVATGEAAVTLDAEGQGMVTGDLVNTASRLQDAAQPGSVLIDAATRNIVGEAIALEPAGELQLKGKASPVAAWRAVAVADHLGSDARAGHKGPFVGRDAERRALTDLLAAVQDERRMRVVSLVGVAGIGKSRLAWEVEHLTVEGRSPPIWYAGRAPGYGEAIAFAPLAEMVRRAIGVAEGDPIEVARRSLEETLARLGTDPAEREWMTPRLLALLEPGQTDETQREELFATWRRFFEALTEEACVVLLFEDLQWADAGLLDFIDYLADWSRHHAIMVMTLARPELLDARPTWGAGLPHFTAMHLERLTDAAIDQLLAALAPGLPRGIAAQVRARADGVPLFAVEIARMLTEKGPGAEVDLGAAGSEIPDSLHALLAARIDALPATERSLLLTAAVLGNRFRPDALAWVAGSDPQQLRDRLRALIRREFLVMDDDPRSPGRGQLSFVQELVREVAYKTLSRRERHARHLAAAAYFESVDEPDVAEPVAEHLAAAYAATSADQPDKLALATRTRGALQRAAERAQDLHAPHRALTHLERALPLADDPATRAELSESAGLAARAAARFATAERHLRDAIALRSQTDPAAAARHRAQLASLLLQAQRSDTALAELESAWSAISGTSAARDGGVEVPAELARTYMLRGDAEKAVEWAERALAAAGDSNASAASVAGAIDARITLGTARAGLGALDEGMTQLRQAIADAETAGLGSIELRAINNLAWLMVTDNPRATSEMAHHGLELAERLGIREMSLQLLDVASIVAIEIGEWDWALSALAEASAGDLPSSYRLDFAASHSIINGLRGATDPASPIDDLGPLEPDLDPAAIGWVDHARALLALLAGNLAEAADLARRSSQRMDGYERWASLTLAGRAAAWSGDLDGAEACLRDLERDPWGVGRRVIDAGHQNLRALVASARSIQSAGTESAAQDWSASLGTWRDLGMPLRQALCHLDRWRVEQSRPDRDAALALAEQLGSAGLAHLVDLPAPQ
ncbi:MAG: AAA family ATPase [Chloroflexota bacterium]|nr:AAA family ATPase [Chloroflexota bacterium]